MNYQISLLIQYSLTKEGKTILKDYSWWISIIEQYCKKANNFEIRCWKGEDDAIAIGKRFGHAVENSITTELVFKGKITDEFQNEIISNYFTKEHSLKWFTLVFYRDETMLFSSEHYGAEPHLLNVPADEIPKINSWTKKYPDIQRVDVYEMNDEMNEGMDEILNFNVEELQQLVDGFLKRT